MTLGFSVGTNHDRRLWFVLILFVAAVLLPTACVLWLINDSISKAKADHPAAAGGRLPQSTQARIAEAGSILGGLGESSRKSRAGQIDGNCLGIDRDRWFCR